MAEYGVDDLKEMAFSFFIVNFILIYAHPFFKEP